MKKIQVVLWDIDGTLLSFEKAEKQAIHTCFSKFQLGECSDEMLKEYSCINRGYWERLERGEITKQQVLEGRFEEFFANHGFDISLAKAFNAEYQIRLGDTICFMDHALEVILALKGHVKQYAVTNGTKIAQERKLERSGLGDLLDGTFISDVIGYEKPMEHFFDAVWDEIGEYDKDSVLIIGDSLTSDMKGGNNVGIVCCWYNPNGVEKPDNIRIDYEIKDLNQVLEILDSRK